MPDFFFFVVKNGGKTERLFAEDLCNAISSRSIIICRYTLYPSREREKKKIHPFDTWHSAAAKEVHTQKSPLVSFTIHRLERKTNKKVDNFHLKHFFLVSRVCGFLACSLSPVGVSQCFTRIELVQPKEAEGSPLVTRTKSTIGPNTISDAVGVSVLLFYFGFCSSLPLRPKHPESR